MSKLVGKICGSHRFEGWHHIFFDAWREMALSQPLINMSSPSIVARIDVLACMRLVPRVTRSLCAVVE